MSFLIKSIGLILESYEQDKKIKKLKKGQY